jgi:hypothetical protein
MNRNLVGSIYGRSSIQIEWFRRRRILKISQIRNNNRLWWTCLLMDRDGMSNLYRGPSIDASYQVSDHLNICLCGKGDNSNLNIDTMN